MANEKKKTKRLVLEDYQTLRRYTAEKNDEELEEKLERKIDQLENPPERTPREKTGFQCVGCKHKFKQVRNHCPTCDSEKLKVIPLSEFT